MANNTNNILPELDSFTVADVHTCLPSSCPNYINPDSVALKIIHQNIRSIGKNLDEFLTVLRSTELEYDIMVFSECWLSKNIIIPILDGYKICQTTKNRNQNDGVVVYIREDLEHQLSEPMFTEANCLLLRVMNKVDIIAMYRSPSTKLDTFYNDLNNFLSSHKYIPNLLVVGDININISPDSTSKDKDHYLNLISSHGLIPAFYTPTRYDSCLDHVLLKCTNKVTILKLETLITDHIPVVASINLSYSIKMNRQTTTIFDHNAIVRDINSLDFSLVLHDSDVDSATNNLIEMLVSTIKDHSKEVRVSKRKNILKPWISTGLLRCIRHRDKLHKKAKASPDDFILNKTFKRYRNFCNNLLRKIKREYERSELLNAKGNPKNTWDVLKKIANIQTTHSLPTELLNLSSNPTHSLNIVNELFAGVGKRLADKILNTSPSTLIPAYSNIQSQSNSIVLLPVDEVEIETLIRNLRNNSASGWDRISSKILKACCKVLVPPITHICNLAIETGSFPAAFKIALVHPIHKSGPKNCVDNYRPISVLTALSKVLEKVINGRLNGFLEKYNIISGNQFGFRSQFSTEDAVDCLTRNVVDSLDSKAKCLGIFLDLSKAFDTVSHQILLTKLHSMGVRGSSLSLLESYLKNRSQMVSVSGYLSDKQTLYYGVPQGSVLGPTLFKIYINALCELKIPNCKILSYADDTALIINGNTWTEVKQYAEQALRIVMRWLNINLLTLNIEKTKYLTFSLRKCSKPLDTFVITAHNCDDLSNCSCISLTRSSTVKYLGVLLDDALNWHAQIDSVCSRVRKLIFMMRKLRSSADRDSLYMVYESLCKSIISYCLPVWGGADKTAIIKLERAQRAVLKVMLFKHFRHPTAELYEEGKVLTVRQLFVLLTVLRRHKTGIPVPIEDTTRRRKTKPCPSTYPRTTFATRQYGYLSSHLYNKVDSLLNIVSYIKFEVKNKVKEWLLNMDYETTETLLLRR